jgi:hypothetical protein
MKSTIPHFVLIIISSPIVGDLELTIRSRQEVDLGERKVSFRLLFELVRR